MSRKLTRLLFVASMVAGASAPMLATAAAPQIRSVDAYDPPKGFVVPGADATNRIDINPGDAVGWNIMEGKHTVTPKDAKQWGGDGSGDLTPDSSRYEKQFKSPGDFFYYCSIHSKPDDVGKPGVGMWGVVHVIDPNATPATTATTTPTPTTTPTTSAPTPTTATTGPAVTPTTTAPASSAGTHAPTAAPAPTTTTAAKTDKKSKDPKDPKDETTTSTAAPAPPPVDLSDEAIVPSLPGLDGTSSVQDGAISEAPGSTPEGDAVALLKSKKNGGNAVKLLIISGIGLGGLGIGTAGYKWANRSSKYFPA